MDDNSEIAGNPNRPEILVSDVVEFMKTHAGTGRIELEVECCSFDGFLFVAGEFDETVCEGVGDAEVHQITRPFSPATVSPAGQNLIHSFGHQSPEILQTPIQRVS